MPLFPDKNQIPSWPTKMGKRWANGMCQGTDRSIWLYRKVPLGPVDDAVDTASLLAVPDPLIMAVREMERLSRARVTRRQAVKSMFRQTHMLLINVPERYVPDDEQPLKDFLSQQHPRQLVDRRLLLFGVKIKDDLGAHGGWKGRVESLVQTFSEDGVPIQDFMDDFEQVDRALRRSGLLVPSQDDFLLADAWWNLGRDSDTPVLPHDDHMHVFASHGAMSQAWALEEDETPCEDWPKMPGHHKMAMLAFRELEFQSREADQPSARWASAIRQQGAAAISIRGLIEPARVTRAELRRNRNRFRSDIREQQAADKMERAEMLEASEMLARREAEYSAEGAYPTLIDTSVVVAMNGALDGGRFDPAGITPDSAAWSNMLGIQDRALEETMLCSNVRANPLLKDVPIATVAYSGLPSLSVVGDREGALLGFTERDHQPAYVSHKAAYVADTLPILLVAGATGSGKTMVLLYLAWQWSQLEPQIPQVIVDPKVDSDHSDVVEAAGGRVFSLDDLTRSDGVFDPLRFAGNAQAGVEVATSMLLQVDPWREDKKAFESELQVALKYGVDNGATCIGQALLMAQEAEMASDALVQPVLNLIEASSIFRACVGMDPQGDGLRVSNGISLIKVGNTHLDLPQPGKEPETMNQRLAIALVRMMVFGSAMAMTGRNGVLHFDEAWVAMAGGATEMERLGRLARSQTVLPVLYTQRVSDAVNNGLAGYISRGLIMHISDKEEATAACALFNLEPDLRVPRITMPGVTGGSTADVGGTPEWSSLRALKDPITGKVLRGSVAIYKDLAGRAVPVTVTLPPEFLNLASTNPEDIKRKKLARLAFEEKQLQAEAATRSEEMGSEEHRRMSQTTVPDELAEVMFDPGEDLSLRREQVAGAVQESDEADDLEDVFGRA